MSNGRFSGTRLINFTPYIIHTFLSSPANLIAVVPVSSPIRLFNFRTRSISVSLIAAVTNTEVVGLRTFHAFSFLPLIAVPLDEDFFQPHLIESNPEK